MLLAHFLCTATRIAYICPARIISFQVSTTFTLFTPLFYPDLAKAVISYLTGSLKIVFFAFLILSGHFKWDAFEQAIYKHIFYLKM